MDYYGYDMDYYRMDKLLFMDMDSIWSIEWIEWSMDMVEWKNSR